jgi:formate hydrogenlyase subunit 4
MTTSGGVAAAVELVGGVVLAPLLPGLVQHWKARLQGRRGPTPLQPYRELRRLWRKSVIDVDGTSFLYPAAPAVAVAAMGAAVLLVPVAAGAPGLGVGHDLLALAGLLALARLVVALSAWDVANGFSLMGASRDLTIAVFVEITMVLAFAVAALVAGTTNLAEIVAATAGAKPWESPALPLGAVAFALVLVSETGRQPIDNPDTHLELTMIHEGLLLEYGGRDLAMLQWAVAARHWLVLVLAAQVFVPHFASPWGQLAALPATVVASCAGLAITETLVVKMRILLAPRLVGIGAAIALLGVAAWIVETT